MLLTARGLRYLSSFVHDLQGQFAEWYNFRKKRSNQFWGGRNHATMIESGTHLWNCMTYIDLNMVRAGVVKHPREWRWGGYDELVNMRARHTVLRKDKLLELVGAASREQFARDYAAALEEALDRGGLRREPHGTEAIAVGSREYVAAIDDRIRGRMRTKLGETQGGAWAVREPDAPYGQISGTRVERKRGVRVLNWRNMRLGMEVFRSAPDGSP